jgi:hypothetical protein
MATTTIVWVLYTDDHQVQVYFKDGSSVSRDIGDELSPPGPLPGWELPVAKLFQD